MYMCYENATNYRKISRYRRGYYQQIGGVTKPIAKHMLCL